MGLAGEQLDPSGRCWWLLARDGVTALGSESAATPAHHLRISGEKRNWWPEADANWDCNNLMEMIASDYCHENLCGVQNRLN